MHQKHLYADCTIALQQSQGQAGMTQPHRMQICAHHKQQDFVILVVLGGSTTGAVDVDDGCLPAHVILMYMATMLIHHHEVFPH